MRAAVDGRLRVFRSLDAGRSWDSASAGLPQEHAYVTVLREGLDVHARQPGRVCFGTSSGHVFFSANRGDDWQMLAEFLPRVLTVRFVATEA